MCTTLPFSSGYSQFWDVYVKNVETVWMFVTYHTACQSAMLMREKQALHVTTLFELLSFLLTKQELAKTLTSQLNKR